MKKLLAAVLGSVLVGTAGAAVFEDYGSSPNNTSQAEGAFTAWQSRVTSFSVDQLAGLTGSSTSMTSALGSVFTRTNTNTTVGASTTSSICGAATCDVMQGNMLSVNRSSIASTAAPGAFTWTLAPAPANAFGFFGWDLDGGTLTVTFVDNTSITYTRNTSGNTNQNSSTFWGISGLSSLIATVTITSSDPGGISYFDRFVTGVSRAAVPEPGSLALVGLALLGVAAARRRAA